MKNNFIYKSPSILKLINTDIEKLFILTHTYENKEFYPLMKNENIKAKEIDLLVFYIQCISNSIEIHFSLSSNELKDILVNYYGFKYLGEIQYDESEEIEDEIYNVINLYTNWEKYCGKYYDVILCKNYYREGLKEYISKLISEGNWKENINSI